MIKAQNNWRASHDGNLPKTWPEKTEFKTTVKAMRTHNGLQGYNGENFDEAEPKAMMLATTEESIPENVLSIFSNTKIGSH